MIHIAISLITCPTEYPAIYQINVGPSTIWKRFAILDPRRPSTTPSRSLYQLVQVLPAKRIEVGSVGFVIFLRKMDISVLASPYGHRLYVVQEGCRRSLPN